MWGWLGELREVGEVARRTRKCLQGGKVYVPEGGGEKGARWQRNKWDGQPREKAYCFHGGGSGTGVVGGGTLWGMERKGKNGKPRRGRREDAKVNWEIVLPVAGEGVGTQDGKLF